MISIRSLRPSYFGEQQKPERQTGGRAYYPHQEGWSETEIENLRARWLRGETSNQISEALNRSRSSVMGKIRRLGLTRGEAA